MKIKSIDDLTLAECQEYLDVNPNGEHAREVSVRMEYLQGAVQNKKKQELEEYEKEYRRLYATEKFLAAFYESLHILSMYGEIKYVRKNAEEALKHISPKHEGIASPKVSVEVDNDWLIDLFSNNGYKLAIISPDKDYHYERIRIKRVVLSDYAFKAYINNDKSSWIYWKYKGYSLPSKKIIIMIGNALIEEAILCGAQILAKQ